MADFCMERKREFRTNRFQSGLVTLVLMLTLVLVFVSRDWPSAGDSGMALPTALWAIYAVGGLVLLLNLYFLIVNPVMLRIDDEGISFNVGTSSLMMRWDEVSSIKLAQPPVFSCFGYQILIQLRDPRAYFSDKSMHIRLARFAAPFLVGPCDLRYPLLGIDADPGEVCTALQQWGEPRSVPISGPRGLGDR